MADIAAFEPISSGSGDLDRHRGTRRPHDAGTGSPRRSASPGAALRVGRAQRLWASLGALTPAPDGGPLPPAGAPEPVTDARARRPTPDPESASRSAEPAAPRITTFGLEGRAVPGLYLVGWIASLMGAGLLFISFQADGAGHRAVGVPRRRWSSSAIGLTFAAGSQAIERGRRPDLAYRGPSPVLAFLVVVVLTFVGADRGAGAAVGPGPRRPVPGRHHAQLADHHAGLRRRRSGCSWWARRAVVARHGCRPARRRRAAGPAAGGAAGGPRRGRHAASSAGC